MKNIELKHIVGYFSHGLKVKTDSLGIFEIDGFRTLKTGDISLKSNDTHIGFLKETQPILLPLSDLTKEFHEDFINFFDENNLLVIEIDSFYGINCFYGDGADLINYSDILQLIDLLHKHHFDIYRLIEKGLAIDKNTLP